jgi:hypothetical protein
VEKVFDIPVKFEKFHFPSVMQATLAHKISLERFSRIVERKYLKKTASTPSTASQ